MPKNSTAIRLSVTFLLMSYVVLQQKTKRVVAGLLAVWMSGAVLLFCCAKLNAESSGAESCPLSKISHCDKKVVGADVSKFASLQTDSQMLDCCRFPSQVFDKARKLETDQQAAEIASTVKISAATVYVVQRISASPKVHQSFIRNRGSTYLRNRVFRI